jgi:hypothetical protein
MSLGGDLIFYIDKRPKLVKLLKKYTEAVSDFFSDVFTSKPTKEQKEAWGNYYNLMSKMPPRDGCHIGPILYAKKKD